MLKKLFKNKKNRYKNLILVLLPFVILIGVFAYTSYSSLSSVIGMASGNNKQILSIESMDYHLRNDATDLQKELFKELSKAVEDNVDGEKNAEIAGLVAQNYVADFYTWSNKKGSFDIGGMYYVHSPSKLSIYYQARDSFYKYVSHYINEYGNENLLEVESVEVQVGGDTGIYEYNGKSYPYYYVMCDWTYVDHEDFDESTYRTREYFSVIINEDDRFEIVQAYGD